MRRLCIFFLVFLSIFVGLGCKKIKGLKEALIKPEEEKQTVKPVESTDLAQAIIWPKPYQFDVSRDPFKPLLGIPVENIEELVNETNIKVVGILSKEGKPLVLLETPEGVSIFREGDKIGKYTVKKIELKKVTLEKENKNFILEIGEEK